MRTSIDTPTAAMPVRSAGRNTTEGVAVVDLDPFAVPEPSSSIGAARHRSRVVLSGLILDVDPVHRVGPVLDVTVSDGSGSVCVSFLGRRGIPGFSVGRVLTVAGMLGAGWGRPTLLNPQYWLHTPLEVVDDA